jgi:hypothetical protein
MRVESHVLDLYGICERCSLAGGEAADDAAGAAGHATGSS